MFYVVSRCGPTLSHTGWDQFWSHIEPMTNGAHSFHETYTVTKFQAMYLEINCGTQVRHDCQLINKLINIDYYWSMVHGSRLTAHGARLMAHVQGGRPGPRAQGRAGPRPGPGGAQLGPRAGLALLAMSLEP